MQAPYKWIAVAIGAIAVLALLAWQTGAFSLGLASNVGLLSASDQEDLAAGKILYAENCASCHGVNLEGQPNWQGRDSDGYLPAPPHDETGHTWHHDDALLFGITKFGIAKYAGGDDYKTRMPAYEEILTDNEIRAVLSYIKSQWPQELRERHDEMNAPRN